MFLLDAAGRISSEFISKIPIHLIEIITTIAIKITKMLSIFLVLIPFRLSLGTSLKFLDAILFTKQYITLKILGKRIAKLRKQRGLNQENFADISGKMINTISNIERGLSDPKITTLMSIAKALNISIEELFTGNEPKQVQNELPKNITTIIQILKKQDDKTIKVIQKQIEALLELIQ